MSKIKICIIAAFVLAFFPGDVHAGFYDWIKEARTGQSRLLAANFVGMENNWYLSNVYNQSEAHKLSDTMKLEPVIEITEELTGFSVTKVLTVRATGYSSTPDQTDSTPFITASGSRVRDGIIAANFHLDGRRVPFGTKVKIPELFGNKVFIVEDRMNARYTNNIDIWFPERGIAQRFGSKTVRIEIIHDQETNS